MDTSGFFNTLLAADNPLLPNPTAMRLALPAVWALVLGSGTLLMAGKLARPYQWGAALLVMAWTLLPGGTSPAYWLGLAFQTPSLMSAAICLAWLLTRARRGPAADVGVAHAQMQALTLLAAAGMGLGWVLLLDTLAWLPVSVYAWGFSAAAFGAVAVLAVLLWVVQGGAGKNQCLPGRGSALLLLSVLALFVLTRLPTGNVWDALLDPWLWGALQLRWLISATGRLGAGKHAPPATRA